MPTCWVVSSMSWAMLSAWRVRGATAACLASSSARWALVSSEQGRERGKVRTRLRASRLLNHLGVVFLVFSLPAVTVRMQAHFREEGVARVVPGPAAARFRECEGAGMAMVSCLFRSARVHPLPPFSFPSLPTRLTRPHRAAPRRTPDRRGQHAWSRGRVLRPRAGPPAAHSLHGPRPRRAPPARAAARAASPPPRAGASSARASRDETMDVTRQRIQRLRTHAVSARRSAPSSLSRPCLHGPSDPKYDPAATLPEPLLCAHERC